jgi:hypothetical protein
MKPVEYVLSTAKDPIRKLCEALTATQIAGLGRCTLLRVDLENGRYVGTHYGVDLAMLDAPKGNFG